MTHVAIIGGGFSGTMQAINLLRHDGPRATLIEARPHPGRGVAYSAAHPDHLLNVRASNMSAIPDDPGHFVRWLEARGLGNARTFVPRLTYGDYLTALLDEKMAKAGDRLTIVQGAVVALERQADTILTLADGRTLQADTAVLAIGNLPPHAPPGLDPALLGLPAYAEDPWAASTAESLDDDDTVVLVGTGLTMVDVALLLDASGFRGRILALSRRGLLPHTHANPPLPPVVESERPPTTLSELTRTVRERAAALGWQAAVDGLRPYTQSLWRSWDVEERARFLRHLRPWWDIHRHRLSPPVGARIDAMVSTGRLEVVSGKIESIVPDDQGVRVTWRSRGGEAVEQTRAARLVNCTGPQGDLGRSNDPLLRDLLAKGHIRPDENNLGIDVDAEAQTIAADSAPNSWLLALGPMTRGAFWEIVAIPDIRVQTWAVARKLSHAHWVGGEGL